MMNYIFLIAGILVFNLMRLNTEIKKPDFSWLKFFIENGIPSIIAIIVGVCLILGKGITQQFIEISIGIAVVQVPIYLLLGICVDVILKKLWITSYPGSQTAIGINKYAGDDPPQIEPDPTKPKPR
jgi:hypothetical protein